MARRVFFSFQYENDISRAMVVRNSWLTQEREAAGFVDAAEFEKVKNQGEKSIKQWIDQQLKGTSVTVILVGQDTNKSKYVKYEIQKSIEVKNGLLGIDISKIKDLQKKITDRCDRLPTDRKYKFYLWNKNKGYDNLGNWVEAAAMAAGR